MEDVDLAPERACHPDIVDGVDPEMIHEQPHAGIERGLRELDRADVILGDENPWRSIAEDVGEGPPVRRDSRRPIRQCSVDHPIGGHDPGEKELGNDLDDPRSADSGHARRSGRLGEPRLVRPDRAPDHPEPWLERGRVDADPFDRARRGALAAADLGALECRPRRARRGEKPIPVAEDDLGIRPDVHDEVDRVGVGLRLLGQDHPRRVRADVTGDARQDIDPRPWIGGQSQLTRADADGAVGRQRERRRAEGHGVDPEE